MQIEACVTYTQCTKSLPFDVIAKEEGIIISNSDYFLIAILDIFCQNQHSKYIKLLCSNINTLHWLIIIVQKPIINHHHSGGIYNKNIETLKAQ